MGAGPWFIVAAFYPSDPPSSRGELEVRCSSCAGKTTRAIGLAPAELVAWLATERAACRTCGVLVTAPASVAP